VSVTGCNVFLIMVMTVLGTQTIHNNVPRMDLEVHLTALLVVKKLHISMTRN